MAHMVLKSLSKLKISHKPSIFQDILISTIVSKSIIRNVRTSTACYGVIGKPVKMPSLSPTMTEGTIVKWMKQEGDTISPGDVLCEIQTDKAVVSMDTEEEGVLAKILINEDSRDIQVGSLIALMVEEGEDFKDVEIPAEESIAQPSDEKDLPPSNSIPEVGKDDNSQDLKIGPAAKNLLEKYGLQSSKVPASGPRYTLSKEDVLNYVAKNKIDPKDFSQLQDSSPTEVQPVQSTPLILPSFNTVTESEYIDIDVTSMRRTIAKRLTQSKTTIPHAYCSIACSVNEILDLRKSFKSDDIKVSVNDFIIKSAAMALKRVPEVNSQWTENSGIKQLKEVDISIAVATDSGLITPIVKSASDIGVKDISDTVKELAGRARIGKLLPEEFIGGSFSISNLGMFGISEFSAVINPPQAAILAIGSTDVIAKEKRIGEEMKISADNVLTCTLSYDSRVVSEEAAIRFMEVFRENMENPVKNLLDGLKSKPRIAMLM